ncbi:MAG: L-aspartate oxidase [Ectothiorhodospiraceae bacterium]|nr:L-aspartate oxidase [Ectothiorhodospiraceae bacterium]
MSKHFSHDVLVIGSGAAGLSLILRLAPSLRVAVISKGPVDEGSSKYAQGGISAVLDPADSIESHVQDTLIAGAGLCNSNVAQITAERSAEQIHWLSELGTAFSTNDSASRNVNDDAELHLTREGGHSQRRVAHAADATGRAMANSMLDALKARPNTDLFEHHIAVDLITANKLGHEPQRALGAYVLNRESEHIEVFHARSVVLATGGASKVYLYTTNPDVSTGDGIAMAWRAGCRVANMEFIQFHPTCLYHPKAKSFLVSEALRGEGAHLLLPDGSRFMHKFDDRGELAPRDIVARAMDHEMKRLGVDCVYIDISFKSKDFITSHFPNIYKRCLAFGFDMTKGPLPVVPAAHYTCGGVMTDPHGRTDIDGLYAIGETAFTGLHGANRLASNSLLECLVFGEAAANDINHTNKDRQVTEHIPDWDESRVTDSDEEVVVSHNWDELRRFMWDYVGIVRSDKRLQRAMRRADLLVREIEEYYSHFRISGDLIELRNLVQAATLIIRSAMSRRESRGLHYTLDHPETDNTLSPENTILVPPNFTSQTGTSLPESTLPDSSLPESIPSKESPSGNTQSKTQQINKSASSPSTLANTLVKV